VRFVSLFALLAVVLGSAGCGGSNNNSTPTVVCALPAGTSVTLVYPIPNSTGVPDSLGSVVLAVKPALPIGWQIVLGSSSAASYFGGVLTTGTPVPLPTPIAPTPAGSTLQYSTFVGTGGLPANTVLQVGLNNTNASCNSFPTFGSFTTQ
jgi:hypothetical protein